MRVEITVSRSAYPVVGQVIDIDESQAQYLVDAGLAVKVDNKPVKKTVKKTPIEEK